MSYQLGRLLARLVRALIGRPAAQAHPTATAPRRAPKAPTPIAARLPVHTWPSLGRFEQDIVGESHYQPQLQAIAAQLASTGAQSFSVHLVPEADNPHDAHAVAVHHQGTCIGYLSRDDARRFRRRLGAKRLTGQTTSCQATLIGGHQRRDDSRALLGVALDIKPFD